MGHYTSFLTVIKKYIRAWLFGYCINDQMCNDCSHDYNEDKMKLKLDKNTFLNK